MGTSVNDFSNNNNIVKLVKVFDYYDSAAD